MSENSGEEIGTAIYAAPTCPATRGHPPIDIVMDAAKSVTAHFKPDVTLTLAKVGVGDVNPDVGVHTFIRDHVASVSASPANGFDHWEGDLEEDDNPANPMQVVELKQSKSLTAVFKPMYTLTVAREGDGGTVSPGVGPHDYRSGESASLSAYGNDEWLFTGWSGDVSGTLPLQSVTMNANKSATAHFVQAIKITVNKVGQGSVSPGTGVYAKGGTRTFTATPATDWRWDHWEGVPSGQEGDPSLELPMDQSRTITAHFVERAKLAVVKELIGNLPADGGTVSPGEGVHEYDKGEVVSLSATHASGWRFKQWSGGGASGDDSPVSITMSGDKTVTATFIQQHTVTAESQSHGIVTPESGTWDHGQSASFAWEREQWLSFFQFTHWAGLPDSFTTTEWGAGTSDQETVNFTVNDSYHLIAYDESVVVLLTADVDADGCTECTVDPAIPTAYIRDTEATVTATPGAGWGFVRWEGDVPAGMEEDNPLVMTMDENKNVTAVFKEYTLDIVGVTEMEPFLIGDTVELRAVIDPRPTGSVTYQWATSGDAAAVPSSGSSSTFEPTFTVQGMLDISLVATVSGAELQTNMSIPVYFMEIVPPATGNSTLESGVTYNFEGHFNRLTYEEVTTWTSARFMLVLGEWENSIGGGVFSHYLQAMQTSYGANTLTFSLETGGKVFEKTYDYSVGCPNGVRIVSKTVAASSTANSQRINASLPTINDRLSSDTDGDQIDDVALCLNYAWSSVVVDPTIPDPFFMPDDWLWYIATRSEDLLVVNELYDNLQNMLPGATLSVGGVGFDKSVVMTIWEQFHDEGSGPPWLLTFHELGHQSQHAHNDYVSPLNHANVMHTEIAAWFSDCEAEISAGQLPW